MAWLSRIPSITNLPGAEDQDEIHRKEISSLIVTPAFVVTGSQDSSIRIWPRSSRTQAIQPLLGHSSAVVSLAISDIFGILFSGDSKGNLIAWDLASGALLQRVDAPHGDVVLAMECTGEHLVTGSRDGLVKVWRISGTNGQSPVKLMHTLIGHKKPVLDVQIHGDIVLSTSGNRTLRMCDLETGKLQREICNFPSAISHLQVYRHPSGAMQMLAACTDGKVRTYDFNSGRETACLEGHNSVVTKVHMLDSERILSASYDGMIRVWEQNADENWETMNTFSFTDASLLKLPEFIYSNVDDDFLQVDSKPSRIRDFQVDGECIFCCGQGRDIVCWDFRDSTTRQPGEEAQEE